MAGEAPQEHNGVLRNCLPDFESFMVAMRLVLVRELIDIGGCR